MIMLDEADILNLIRLNELELQETYNDLESPDEEKRNNAGEMVMQIERLSEKLKIMYEEKKPDYTIYPRYEKYIEEIKKVNK